MALERLEAGAEGKSAATAADFPSEAKVTAAIGRERLLAFAPDPARGRALNREVKRRLVESLREVAAASRAVVEFDDRGLAAALDDAGRAEHLSARLFALYYDLLHAIEDDDLDAAAAMLGQLAEGGLVCDALKYRNFTEQSLGAGQPARLRKLIDADPENPLHLCAIDPREFARITRLADQAFALLDAGAPEISGEIRGLVSEIVFAGGRPGADAVFHGVSSFLTWGALFINAQGHPTVLDLAQTLAHESSHLHLFGVALDEPLVLNPDEERHASPLRSDPRPMDGVYHATYVAARMHYALARLLESGALDAAQRRAAEVGLRQHADAFEKGLATVRQQGRLSDLGRELLARAADYMSGRESRSANAGLAAAQ